MARTSYAPLSIAAMVLVGLLSVLVTGCAAEVDTNYFHEQVIPSECAQESEAAASSFHVEYEEATPYETCTNVAASTMPESPFARFSDHEIVERHHASTDAARKFGLARWYIVDASAGGIVGIDFPVNLQNYRFRTATGVLKVRVTHGGEHAAFYLFEGNDRSNPLQRIELDGKNAGYFRDLDTDMHYSIVATEICYYDPIHIIVDDGMRLMFLNAAPHTREMMLMHGVECEGCTYCKVSDNFAE